MSKQHDKSTTLLTEIHNISPDDILKNFSFNLPGHLYWKDLRGNWLGCNIITLHALGLNSIKQVLGKTDYDFFTKEQADELRRNDLKVIQSGEPSYFEERVTFYNKETRVYIASKIPFMDKHGNIIGIIGNSLDITDLKQTQNKLVAAKEKAEMENRTTATYLKNVVACTPGCLYWKDKDGYWLGCNNYMLKELGLPAEYDVKGKTDYDFFTNEQAKQLRSNDIEVMKENKIVSREEIVTIPNTGEVKTYAAVKMPLTDAEGNIIGIIGNSLDITELKQAQAALLEAKEKAEASNQAKELFVQNMSHDFKTPLNGIFGVVQIMSARKEELPDDLKTLVDVQEKSVLRLKKLVDSILNYTKLVAGHIQIQQEELNLLEIIESIVQTLTPQLKNRPLDIIISYPPEVPRHLIGDSYCVTSIILNLVSNAVKYTNKGYISIAVKVITQNANMVTLQIAVEDTGTGIPTNQLEQIFDRFHRLDFSNTGLKEGHGIGLAVVKELVEKINGEIKVESREGTGSIFKINLPFEILGMSFFVSEWKKRHPTVRILLACDKQTTPDVFLDQFGKNMVHKVVSSEMMDVAQNAAQQGNPYQIAIIDDEVEHINIYTIIQTIAKLPSISKLMWILSTRPRDKEWFDTARSAGYFDFLIKPVLPSELDQKIIDTWERWQKNKK